MKHLWTPWRMNYITGEKKQVEGCLFCHKPHGDVAAEHIIAHSQHVYVTLNKYPYNNGHLMVVPFIHVASQEELETDALTDLGITINRCLRILRLAYNPPAFNLGANIGEAAGAGIAAHYHFHIVPRWAGDANFMTAVGDTRIIPDTLDNTYDKLSELWHQTFS